MNAMLAKAATLNTDALKAEIEKLANDSADWAGVVLSALIDALETKLPAAAFIEFCDGL
ncbi:MAG TPA: hypothetical protein VIP27_10375 [Variovorax sp.]